MISSSTTNSTDALQGAEHQPSYALRFNLHDISSTSALSSYMIKWATDEGFDLTIKAVRSNMYLMSHEGDDRHP